MLGTLNLVTSISPMKLKPIGIALGSRLAFQLLTKGKLPTGNQAMNAALEEAVAQWYKERGIDITTSPNNVQN